MGKLIGYGKLGRSMPLTLERCGNLGGDVECVAVVTELALRHPEDTFLLIGRNSGERPTDVGLPANVINPWCEPGYQWKFHLDERVRHAGLKGVPLTTERQLELAKIFDEITGPTFDRLDAMVMWIGQHGTSNTPIPKVDDPTTLTQPQEWSVWYAGFLLRGINRWRDVDPWNREEVNLNADPRNRHKMRDLKWPLRCPVLTQYTASKTLKHERYGDPDNWEEWSAHELIDGFQSPDDMSRTWVSRVHDMYSRIEINALSPTNPFGRTWTFDDRWEDRAPFGIIINETRRYVKLKRSDVVREWVLPLDPAWIHGTWSDEGMKEIGREVKPLPPTEIASKLHTVRCTFTTPASGSGWATAKPWEAFAAGVVCFFHPAYDTQDNILGDAPSELRDWLRVKSPEQLAQRVRHLSTENGHYDWVWLVNAQRFHLEKALDELRYIRLIEERIWKW